MQLSKNVLCLLGFAASLTYAQNDSSCDPQNDNNNDATCTSNGAAAATSTGNPRLITMSSTVTGVYTPVATSTNVVFGTTSLPHSLDTVTNTLLSTSATVFTSESVFTTNTLGDAATTSVAAAATTAANGAERGLVPVGGLVAAVMVAVDAL